MYGHVHLPLTVDEEAEEGLQTLYQQLRYHQGEGDHPEDGDEDDRALNRVD